MKTLYQENAFRLLGIPANATRAVIRDVYQSLRVRSRVGSHLGVNDHLSSICSLTQTEDNIRDAYNILQNPQARLKERLFWFMNSTKSDKEVLERLLLKDLKGAIEIWETDQSYTAIANLARLCHAICIFKKPTTPDTNLWMKAFKSWHTTIESNNFWKHFMDIEMASGFEPLATISDIEVLRNESWKLVLQPSIDIFDDAINNKEYDTAQHYLNLINISGFPVTIVRRVEAELLEPLENRIEVTTEDIRKTLADTLEDEASLEIKRKACNQAYQSYKNALFLQIEQLTKIADVNSETVKRARKIVGTCLRNIAIEYHNHAEDYQIAENILKEAIALVSNSLLAERWEQEDLPILKKHAEDERIKIMPIANLCATIIEKLSANGSSVKKSVINDTLNRTEREVMPMLKELKNSIGSESNEYKKVANIVSRTLRSISVSLHNGCNDFRGALIALQRAKYLCFDEELLNLINGDIDLVRKHLNEHQSVIRKRVFKYVAWSAIILLVVGYIVWDVYHATLYIDNGTGYDLELSFKEWKIFSAPPGVTTIEIPVGDYYVDYSGKTTQLHITNGGKWVFNPERMNYYRRYEVYYGSRQGEPNTWEVGNPELVEVNDTYIFDLPPKNIKTKSSSEIRTVFEHLSRRDVFDRGFVDNHGQVPSNSVHTKGYEQPIKHGPSIQLNAEIESNQKKLGLLENSLNMLSSELDSYKTQIELNAAKIKQIEDDYNTGLNVDKVEYEAKLADHNKYVGLYNKKLGQYNRKHAEYKQLLEKTNIKIEEHNRIIRKR